MTDTYVKPIPTIQPWTEAFWKAARQHQLVIQYCSDCQSYIFYPRKRCPECWSSSLEWKPASGRASVYTFTVTRDMVEPKFMPDLPYILALVDLEEGVRMMTRIVECDPENVTIGMHVEVVFEDITETHALPFFRPSDPGLRQRDPKEEQADVASEAASFQSGPSAYETIRYEIGDPQQSVCTITLNRPRKHNAINRRMAAELLDAFRRVRETREIGVVVLAGAGEKSFCTGGDLDIFPSLAEHQTALNWLAHEGLDIQHAITGCEKVVVGKIRGNCLAGGLELALCCDLLYASASSRFGLTEINMGILPGWGGTARIVRSMPVFRAREILYSGRKDYSAAEIFEMGLLTRVFPDDEFETEFQKILENLAGKKPIALRMGKEVMARSAECGDIETALALERNGIQWLNHAPDIQKVMDSYRQSTRG